MKRRSRKNPLATARDLVDVTSVDAGGGNAQLVINGIPGPVFTGYPWTWSGGVGIPDLERPIPGALRLYVDPVNGNDSYNGFTWYRAFKTIQAACNA
ncbi:hypothetical protein, partial [Mycobacterium sp. PSTR-4-N]|uniref:hypothetical protein n=1 Tax=Mycobacterium sp. PSTR-4-N TaxID=2917745 RepID=UPI001F151DA4